MWLITGIFDTLVAKTSYVSSHIRSCLKLHKSTKQGRRRVFKRGPAEEAIECRRHERGESTRRGLIPLSLGGFGGLPRRKILNFEHLYVRF